MELSIEKLNEGLNKVMFKNVSIHSILKVCPICNEDLKFNPSVNRHEHYRCDCCNKNFLLKKNNVNVLDMVEWK